jgi:hypothetical protein
MLFLIFYSFLCFLKSLSRLSIYFSNIHFCFSFFFLSFIGLDSFPLEVLQNIFKHFDVRTFSISPLVSPYWRHAIANLEHKENSTIWKEYCDKNIDPYMFGQLSKIYRSDTLFDNLYYKDIYITWFYYKNLDYWTRSRVLFRRRYAESLDRNEVGHQNFVKIEISGNAPFF